MTVEDDRSHSRRTRGSQKLTAATEQSHRRKRSGKTQHWDVEEDPPTRNLSAVDDRYNSPAVTPRREDITSPGSPGSPAPTRLPDIRRRSERSTSRHRSTRPQSRHRRHQSRRRHYRSSSEERYYLPRVSHDRRTRTAGGRSRRRRWVYVDDDDDDDDYSDDYYSDYSSRSSGSELSEEEERPRSRRHHEARRRRRRDRSTERPSRERAERTKGSTSSKGHTSGGSNRERSLKEQDTAARTIQGATRRYLTKSKRKRDKENDETIRAMAYRVMEDLLDEFVQCEFVPDLLMEVIMQSVDKEFTALAADDQAARDCLSVVVKEAVAELSKEIVEVEIRRFVHMYLRVHRPKDVLSIIVDEIVQETIAPEARGASEEAIIEMTFAYLLDRRCLDTWHVLSDDVIEDLSYEAADEALFEEEMKALHDHVLDEVVFKETEDLVQQMMFEVSKERAIRLHQEEVRAVLAAATRTVIPRMQAQLLFGMVRKRTEDLLIRELSENILQRLVAGRLLALHRETTERREQMRECPALALLFSQLTNRAAFPLLLKELQTSLKASSARVKDEEASGADRGPGPV